MILEKLVGMPTEKAKELAEVQGLEVEIVDFSEPDKYHKDVPASSRVVKAVKKDNSITLFVAGFKDSID